MEVQASTASVRQYGDTRLTTPSSRDVLAGEGVQIMKSPSQAPRADCHAERRVRTVRAGRAGRMLICNNEARKLPGGVIGEYHRAAREAHETAGQELAMTFRSGTGTAPGGRVRPAR